MTSGKRKPTAAEIDALMWFMEIVERYGIREVEIMFRTLFMDRMRKAFHPGDTP